MNEKEKKSKTKWGIIFTIVINVIIVVVIIIKEAGSWTENYQKISLYGVHPQYILFGILSFGAALFVDYFKYDKMITACTGEKKRRDAFNTAVIGKYTDNVTPFGAGGQPFQIHYLYKQGYPSGISAAIPIVGFMSQQIAFVAIALVIFILSFTVELIPFFRVSAVLGLLFYMFVPGMVIFFVILPKPFHAAVNGVLKLLEKMRIVKDGAAKTEAICAKMDEYVESFKAISKRPFLLFKVMALSVVYQLAIMSIPFFMLRAFGATDSWWTVFSMTVFIYASITIIPTPGNAGAAEGAFYTVFSSLEGGPLFWAMILWRALVYYIWIILGVIVYTKNAVKKKE